MARISAASLVAAFVSALSMSGAARADDTGADRYVWRWTASQALVSQQSSASGSAGVQFVQRYERYAPGGQPDAER